jgi:hypothetical protein
MCNPVNLILEHFDVLCLFHELVLRDHKRELSLLMIGIEKFPDYAIDILLNGEAKGEPDAHSFNWIAVVDDLRRHEQLVIPLAEVLLGWEQASLAILSLGIDLEFGLGAGFGTGREFGF